jgi:hypothetical protein
MLTGTWERVGGVTLEKLSELFDLFERHYADVSFERFVRDFAEKEYVILLREGNGPIRGFSTVATYQRTVAGRTVRLLFSGDTIVDEACWGEQELGRVWSSLAGTLSAEAPDVPFYWLLLSKGYRTFLYLPLFFRSHLPAHESAEHSFEREVIDDFACFKYGSDYDASRSVLSFATPHGRLRDDLAVIPEHRSDNPHVRFFLERNPRYAEGEELVCLAELCGDNMRSYARRNFIAARERRLAAAIEAAS